MSHPVILLISHVIPHPPAAGNEIRILKMVTWLRSRGFRIVMLLNHEPIPPARRTELESVIGSVHFIGEDYGAEFERKAGRRRESVSLPDILTHVLPDSRLYRWLFHAGKQKTLTSGRVKAYLGSRRLVEVTRHLCRQYGPVAVIAEYIFAAPCLDAVPRGALKLIDTHDMFSRKNDQVLSFGLEDPLTCSGREERHYLRKSDVIIAIQSHEARMFRELIGSGDVITVGIDFDIAGDSNGAEVVPGTILVVGSDNPLNQHGLKAFHEHAWPAIRAGHAEGRPARGRKAGPPSADR